MKEISEEKELIIWQINNAKQNLNYLEQNKLHIEKRLMVLKKKKPFFWSKRKYQIKIASLERERVITKKLMIKEIDYIKNLSRDLENINSY